MARPVFGKTYKEITKEWDEIALVRLNQIENGQDLSFTHVITPCIFEMLSGCDLSKVIDLGCGTGALTRMIAQKAKHVIGIDISKRNVELAQNASTTFSNIDYINIDIESLSSKFIEASFSTVVASMTLMTVLNLDQVLQIIAKILKPRAHLVFTITHPCFWPLYWNYAKEQWFNYHKEIPVEADFKISLDRKERGVTTHIHRPLEKYVNSLTEAGFSIEKIYEPVPSEEIQEKYSGKWEYPRFMGIKCILTN
ncbi:s-adenosyl-l-methionine-dependent methyltransferase [Lucifera butyrica]|uniref:S-adenosyl-l-methionine-dependent methyltransferase n=1 Tax=Lucifera butyrica TaxID=1351585 RepID=A0A498R391_9FIRM|nr:class I SAM-dependent methyltransferase [Lucifera butyrica]VBB05615.1 s-adenosyl-l-methionine-dependent methyltransferase [Lucifera butyrica]